MNKPNSRSCHAACSGVGRASFKSDGWAAGAAGRWESMTCAARRVAARQRVVWSRMGILLRFFMRELWCSNSWFRLSPAPEPNRSLFFMIFLFSIELQKSRGRHRRESSSPFHTRKRERGGAVCFGAPTITLQPCRRAWLPPARWKCLVFLQATRPASHRSPERAFSSGTQPSRVIR